MTALISVPPREQGCTRMLVINGDRDRIPHRADVIRRDVTAEELMALVAGAFAAIRHANAETSRTRSAHLAQIILDGLRPAVPPR
ncbi:hypothetical protein ACFXO9_31520 [Nocardia tengchongensis]|uniref:SbtR family transcriptional regulator n=1 Tax=Nocardia tengchongensis TaxID=2055889 RepID=UPI00369526C0